MQAKKAAVRGTPRTVRLSMIGPMPPPINGQSVVMEYMVAQLSPHFAGIRVGNVGGEAGGPGWRSSLKRLCNSFLAWRVLFGADVAYIAVKAGRGMWLTTATAFLARLAGARVFLHHHSYAYVRERSLRMVALTHAAGPSARHIVLADAMARDLTKVMPEIRHTLVINNAGLIDRSLSELPLKSGGCIVLGHLSNITLDKGIAEVVGLACALHGAGLNVRLIVGGPIADAQSHRHIDRAASQLGESFEYRGALTGSAKRSFFAEITHFAFPSRYAHEAVPLVLYEAMAAGVVCLATNRGAIAEQMDDGPGLVSGDAESFVDEALAMLLCGSVSPEDSQASRNAYLRALDESKKQIARLAEHMRLAD